MLKDARVIELDRDREDHFSNFITNRWLQEQVEDFFIVDSGDPVGKRFIVEGYIGDNWNLVLRDLYRLSTF